jgi:hypothetical protein
MVLFAPEWHFLVFINTAELRADWAVIFAVIVVALSFSAMEYELSDSDAWVQNKRRLTVVD